MRLADGTTELILNRIQCMRDRVFEIDLVTSSLNLSLDDCCGPPDPEEDSCFNPVNITSNYTALPSDSVIADSTMGGFLVELPANPAINTYVDIYDAQSTFLSNPVTVTSVSDLINSSAGDLVCDINGTHVRFLFNGGAQGWVSYYLCQTQI